MEERAATLPPPLEVMAGGRIPVSIGGVEEVELIELLGVGGYGSVWKVRDLRTGACYALKIVQGLTPGSTTAKRIRLEAGVRVRSVHAVTPMGMCEWDPSTFLLLMEYVPGRSLDHVLADGGLDITAKRAIFGQILAAVADIHAENIIHRDIKPGNLLVADGGGVKLIDFGVSKFHGANLTRAGDLLGTVPYMAPEILIESAIVADARTDIFSLGHVLYELTAGHHYWIAAGWRELADYVDYLSAEPPPSEAIDLRGFTCPFYPSGAEVLARMVKLDPDQRFSSVAEVQDALGIDREPLRRDTGAGARAPHLVVISGSNAGARTLIGVDDGRSVAMGRADLAGADESISRRHLEFSRQDGHYYVRDTGSKNGTLLNSRLLDPAGAPLAIAHQDRIKVGDIYLRVEFVADAARPAAG